MERTITISGKECSFKSSGALPRIYRVLFKKDLFGDMQELQGLSESNIFGGGAMETLENVAYAMAYHYDKTIPSIEEWLENFDTFALMNALPDIISLWTDEITTESTAKKKTDQ